MRLPIRVSVSFALLFSALTMAASCHRTEPASPVASSEPTLRLYVLSTVAGALEPCGCTKDQLGGVDHAAAFIHSGAAKAPRSLVVGAGPMLFLDPKSEPSRATQDLWKAEALATSLGDLGLSAWAPGANDWAAGDAELARLDGLSRAELLAGNLHGAPSTMKATRIVEVGGYKVGLAGVSDPTGPFGAPPGLDVTEPRASLQASLAELKKQGAQIFVALLALDRGKALRLAELAPGYHVFVVGKPYDKGEGNDAPMPPALVGDTLVVEPQNHLQAVGVVDLFVRGDSLAFKDGTGIADVERRESLELRVDELSRRIHDWESSGAPAGDVALRKQDLEKMKTELAGIHPPTVPAEGSYFRYDAVQVHDSMGKADTVATRMQDYYRRVNDHNREAFKDRVPPPVEKGQASYVGVEACSDCHDEAYQFWKHTPHAGAYATLSTQHKEFNLDCVGCHVTGYEKPGGTTVTHVDKLTDVQCEVCHGPGSLHMKNPKDPATLIRSPAKDSCAATCHHVPHVQQSWSVEDAWKIILGKGHGKA
ncbi:MAG TPA: multiheme c-type cytochrome [Polyangiaceae bacterium]|jgi:hypothetical protein|nr:multiheme c-type cytochrome [Polyangiaceae bacterium]